MAPLARQTTLSHCGLMVTVIADGRGTGGRYALAEVRGPQGAATPLHVHEHDDECVVVLEGELDVHLDGTVRTAAAGTAVPMPRRRPHALRIASAAATFLQLWAPAGYEETLRRLAGPVPTEPGAGAPALDPDDVAALLAGAGVTLLPRLA